MSLVRLADQDTDRDKIWKDFQSALEDVFGSGSGSAFNTTFGGSYPTDTDGNKDPDDDAAEEHLRDASNALSSASRFESAWDEDDGLFGAFVGSLSPDDAGDAFQAVDFMESVGFENTDFTRFGAWSKVTRDNATAAPDYDTEVFAYSPLHASKISDVNQYNFRAIYEGETIAVSTDDGELYSGYFQMAVQWNGSGAAEVSSFVRDLRSMDGGDWLQHDGQDVGYILFGNLLVNSSLEVVEGASSTTSIRYRTASIHDVTLSAASAISGTFVGEDVNGPLAVIGEWSLVETGSAPFIHGAFGADLLP